MQLLLTFTTSFALALGSPTPPSLLQESHLDAYLAPYVETGNFSGTVLVAREGQVILNKGYGLADRENGRANEPGTSFYLASSSRIFTSAAILLLAQRGELALSDTVERHLPGWPRGDEITLHHLMTLSSGLPDINGFPGYRLWSLAPQTAEGLCGRIRGRELEFTPGARSVHSNSNYTVLARILEVVSGKSYGDFLRTEFFEPLGMTRTAHDDHPEASVPHRARGYRPVGVAGLEPAEELHWSVKTGSGSIYSTVEDLLRFDRMLAEGTLLNEESVEQLFTEHLPGNGYGWFTGESLGEPMISINGRSPGFGSGWARALDSDTVVIVLGNIYNGVPRTLAYEILDLARGKRYPILGLSTEAPSSEVVEAAVGSYRFGPDFYRPNATVRIHQQEGHLFNGTSWLIPVADGSFVHRTYWSTLRFVEGDPTTLAYDDFHAEREP